MDDMDDIQSFDHSFIESGGNDSPNPTALTGR